LDLALKEQTVTNLRIAKSWSKTVGYGEGLAEAISKQTNLPFVSLSMFRPMEEAIDAIPESMARRLEVVPFRLMKRK